MATSRATIAVVDYGIGNLASLANALDHLGADVISTAQSQELLDADGVVVPGTGAFGASKQAMEQRSIPRWIGQRIAGGRPVLAVCVGHQFMFDTSKEFGEHEGMGEWPGIVEKLPTKAIPHNGWSPVHAAEGSTLFSGLEDEHFYFSHSYAVLEWDFDQGNQSMVPPQVSWAHHGEDFIAAVENGPLTGLQFHPELSGRAGLALLKNWIGTL